jgi:DNA-binding MarR family transcriptional regulator
VSRRSRRGAGRGASGTSSRTAAETEQQPSDEPTLDRPPADQIMQQLTRRDQTDEVGAQRLLRHIAITRSASSSEDGDGMEGSYTIARLLYETAQLWRDRYERELRDQLPNLTGARCTVLIYLAQHEGASQSALAQFLDIRPSTLVRLLDRLEAAGFVTRLPDPHDRRAHVLALAAKARPVITSIYRLVRRSYDDSRLRISKAEVSELGVLLRRIRSGLTDKRSIES